MILYGFKKSSIFSLKMCDLSAFKKQCVQDESDWLMDIGREGMKKRRKKGRREEKKEGKER